MTSRGCFFILSRERGLQWLKHLLSPIAGDRNNHLIFGLTNVSPTVQTPTLDNVKIVGAGPSSVGMGATVTIPVAATNRPSRYVVVFSTHICLTIASLEVY